MQTEGYLLALTMAILFSFVIGLFVGRSTRRPFSPYEWILMQEELRREEDRGIGLTGILFVALVLIVASAATLR